MKNQMCLSFKAPPLQNSRQNKKFGGLAVCQSVRIGLTDP
jgi:hypothetical protein